MTVYNPKDYDNVYTGGQVQFDMENYRSAYALFMACIEYKKRYEGWDETTINHLQYLIDQCLAHF